MKELSIEQKAKRYDEAIERVKKWHNAPNIDKMPTYGNRIIEEIFPELKESNGDGIKEELILYLKGIRFTTIERAEQVRNWIAWLEKQGEHANFLSKIQVGDKVTRNEDGELVNLSQLNRVAKPDDKVKPKFHEGEWITNGDYTWKIVEVKPLDYILQSQDGNIVDDTISHVDEQFHAFTIEDARDGDVLALNDKTIVIFKDLYSSTTFHAYCYVKEGTFNVSQDDIPDWWNSEGFYPATKEQRDTLEKEMTDAGWKFDFDKKILMKFAYARTTGYWNVEDIEQKPAWSEEDEKTWEELIEEVKDQLDSVPAPDCRVKEDEKVLKQLNKWLTWLNSLKDRYTWKPSEEQIKTCKEVYADILSAKGFDLGTVNNELNKLEEQLKKLK